MKNKDYKYYTSPLQDRYFCKEMSQVFSKRKKIETWRALWIELAKIQKSLGLNISDEQIQELEENKSNIDFPFSEKVEKNIQHEVMSHIHSYAKECKKAAPIIHLGATSAFILDNADLILMKEGLNIIESKLLIIIDVLKKLALKFKNLTTLGYTHYQIAQPTTLGKRFSLWLQDFVYDYQQLKYQKEEMPFRGAKGTTGTQDSFLKLFNGDIEKIFSLDELLAKSFGFKNYCLATGQTYSRKIDFYILNVLSGIAQTAHKLTNDFRLLNHNKVLEEAFSENQVGSSAMPYKRNPIIAERIAGLSRYLVHLIQNASYNHSLQWLERTLDDSSSRRIVIPESFLFASYILNILIKLLKTCKINKKLIQKQYEKQIPFLLTEEILMKGVLKGGNRQDLHESIRKASARSHKKILEEDATEEILFDFLAEDANIPFNKEELTMLSKSAKLTGIAEEQVERFIDKIVNPILNNKL